MRRAAHAAALLLLMPDATWAHTVIPGIEGFPGGLLHPLLVPAHALTLIGLGLMAGTLARRTELLLLAIFAAGTLAAFALVALACSAMQAENLVLCLGAAIGVLLASNLAPPAPVAIVVTIAVAIAVIFDSVPPVLTISGTALALTGTALAATALFATAALISRTLPASVRTLGIRIAGSWIAASAIMALALRMWA